MKRRYVRNLRQRRKPWVSTILAVSALALSYAALTELLYLHSIVVTPASVAIAITTFLICRVFGRLREHEDHDRLHRELVKQLNEIVPDNNYTWMPCRHDGHIDTMRFLVHLTHQIRRARNEARELRSLIRSSSQH